MLQEKQWLKQDKSLYNIVMANEFLYSAPKKCDTPLWVMLAGRTDASSTIPVRRGASSDIFVFQYIESGKGVYSIEGKQYRVSAGAVLLTPAWTEHSYRPDIQNPWSKIWFNAAGPLPGMLIRTYGLEGIYHFPNAGKAAAILRNTVLCADKIPRGKVNSFFAVRLHHLIAALADSIREKQLLW